MNTLNAFLLVQKKAFKFELLFHCLPYEKLLANSILWILTCHCTQPSRTRKNWVNREASKNPVRNLPITNAHICLCDSAEYQNELLCTNSQTEYTNKWSRWCVGQLQCRLVDCRNIIFFHRNDMLGTLVFTSSQYWASFSFFRAQSYVLVVVLFSNLLCFVLMTYSNIIILKTSRKKN